MVGPSKNNGIRIEEFNTLSDDSAFKALMQCGGCTRWAGAVLSGKPYESWQDLFTAADRIWGEMQESDWLESFSSHPKIGEGFRRAPDMHARDTVWSTREQAGVGGASTETLLALKERNEQYEAKFGFKFIICASGKSASEMLHALDCRLVNSRETELCNAAAEQGKIIGIRLEKLCQEGVR